MLRIELWSVPYEKQRVRFGRKRVPGSATQITRLCSNSRLRVVRAIPLQCWNVRKIWIGQPAFECVRVFVSSYTCSDPFSLLTEPQLPSERAYVPGNTRTHMEVLHILRRLPTCNQDHVGFPQSRVASPNGNFGRRAWSLLPSNGTEQNPHSKSS